MVLAYLPSGEDGWLPFYVLLVGTTAIGNVISCYTSMASTQRIYSGAAPNTKDKTPAETSPATPLSARTFGTWNLAVGIARVYAAYHMSESSWYQMSILTNVIGIWHFGTEAFVYKTCKPQGPWLAPVTVAVIGLVWHLVQYNNYVKQ